MQLAYTGGCGRPMVWEEDMSGTDPGVGPSGSSRLHDEGADDGRANRELPEWIPEPRDFARACAHPPTVEPSNIVLPGERVQPYRWSFPQDHLHLIENENEPWLLAEALVVMDICGLLHIAVQDVVSRCYVGLIKVGGS